MRKIIICAVIILLSVSVKLSAQSAKVEVCGVKSDLVTVQQLNDSKKRNVILINDKLETIEIASVNPNEIYFIGVNGKVAFFMPVPNEIVKVDVSREKFEFSGAGKKMNNYLQSLSYDYLYTMDNSLQSNFASRALAKKYVYPDMKVICAEDYVDKYKTIREQALKKMAKMALKNKELEAKLQLVIDDLYWEAIIRTYSYLKFKEETSSVALINEIDRYDFDSHRFLSLAEKDIIINNYIKVQEDKKIVTPSLNNYIAQKAQCIKNGDVRDYFILKELRGLVEKKDFIYIDELASTCALLISEKKKEEYDEVCDKIKLLKSKNVLDGVAAEPFTFENQNGEKVSLSDFKGKYVYIDVWATWCGPCKQEIPKLKKFEKEMEGENVVFISLSVDKPGDVETWKSFLKQNEMHGITLATKKGFNVPFVQKYGINAIPRFMLIGPDGIMIANNCWRPSDPRLKEYLLSLLNKK